MDSDTTTEPPFRQQGSGLPVSPECQLSKPVAHRYIHCVIVVAAYVGPKNS